MLTTRIARFSWWCCLAVALAHCVPEARLHRDDTEGASNAGGQPQSDPREGDAGTTINTSGPGGADDGGGASAAVGAAGGESAMGGNAGSSSAGSGGAPGGSAGSGSPPEAAGGPGESAGAGGAFAEEDDGLTGRWTGLTSQGRLFTFDVFGGAVIRVGVNWQVEVPLVDRVCIARGKVETNLGKPAEPDATGQFELGPLAGPPVTYSVKGKLTKGSASGSVSISYPVPGCYGGAEITWNAERVVCGDGHLTWPETCDPNDELRSKGCASSVCQLAPISEQEPNDVPNPSAPKVEDDALIAGSLEEGDMDVFAIRNPLAGTIAVEIETHTETVGSCHVNDALGDTVVEVLDAQGDIVAQDDDGSRSWFCSRLARGISAGQTLYVRIRSFDVPIPAYNLHIKFQKS